VVRDGRGRVEEVRASWGYTTHRTYAPGGDRLAGLRVDCGGVRATAEFADGALTRLVDFDGGRTEVVAENGLLRRIETPNGAVLTYRVPEKGALVVKCDDVYEVEYRFDDTGRLTGVSWKMSSR
jgi:hypothetical protein